MPVVEFIAYVSNVDESLVGLDLAHNLSVVSMPYEEYWVQYHAHVAESWPFMSGQDILMRYSIVNTELQSVCLIRTEIEVSEDDVQVHEGHPSVDMNATINLHNVVFVEYLRGLVEKLRLFAEGDVAIPGYRLHLMRGGRRFVVGGSASIFPVLGRHRYSVADIRALSDFVQSFEFPREREYVMLAHAAFNESYAVFSRGLSFLSLMSSIEALLNANRQEIRRQIARGAAVLLGADINESIEIEKRMKRLYDTRSKLIHAGASNSLGDSEILELRPKFDSLMVDLRR